MDARMSIGRVQSADGRKSEQENAAGLLRAIVAAAFGIRAETLQGGRRGRATVALARQVAIYLAHTRLGLPYGRAGAVFGRDRTTAAHACRRVEDRREDPRLDTMIDYLERAVDLLPPLARLRGDAR
jgi:chromosomal replication initiation ATPase DnaA